MRHAARVSLSLERERERESECAAHSFTLGARTAYHPPGVLNAARCCSLYLSLSRERGGERTRAHGKGVHSIECSARSPYPDGHPRRISQRFTSRHSKPMRAAERRRRAAFGGEHTRWQDLTCGADTKSRHMRDLLETCKTCEKCGIARPARPARPARDLRDITVGTLASGEPKKKGNLSRALFTLKAM